MSIANLTKSHIFVLTKRQFFETWEIFKRMEILDSILPTEVGKPNFVVEHRVTFDRQSIFYLALAALIGTVITIVVKRAAS